MQHPEEFNAVGKLHKTPAKICSARLQLSVDGCFTAKLLERTDCAIPTKDALLTKR
jgi:hypothetical protein